MELSHDEVRKIAELARLELTDAEVALYASQLSSILDYFRMLQELDTSHIPPTASVLPLKNVFREDVAGATLTPDEALKNAHDAHDAQFRVGAILDDN